jgi:flagellar biosynthesis protein FlhF
MLQIFVEQGESRRDCEQKIAEKYKRPFHITREKSVRLGGFLGLFTKEGVEVEFYFSPMLNTNYAMQSYQAALQGSPPQGFVAQAAPRFEEEKNKVIAAAGKDPSQFALAKDSSQERILDELREIKEKLVQPKNEEHPSLQRIAALLKLNDFSETYINNMIEKARGELPLETLDDFDAVQGRLLEWIGESIKIYQGPEQLPFSRRKGKIMVLVGPTGVGKTTTIAKFAAIFGVTNTASLSVRIITIDAYRIGARDQIEKYGDLMGVPVSLVDNRRDLKREIDLHQDKADLILIDTIGKSPKDSVKIGEMKELLDAIGSRAEMHLVLSASTKTNDLLEIMRQFEPFNYQAVILSKLDETMHIGSIICALAEKRKPVSYITDGQIVPEDIKKADVVQFLIKLEDFIVDREKIEKRFPVQEADYCQWSL